MGEEHTNESESPKQYLFFLLQFYLKLPDVFSIRSHRFEILKSSLPWHGFEFVNVRSDRPPQSQLESGLIEQLSRRCLLIVHLPHLSGTHQHEDPYLKFQLQWCH